MLVVIFTEVTSNMNLRELEIFDSISDNWLISATTDVKKDLLKITKKKIRNLKEVDLATLMDNFYQPELTQNTNIGERYDQLNLKFQETLDRCAPEKIVQRTEKPPILWFNHTPCVHVFTLVLMLCISYLDYSNGMLYGSTKKLLQKY